MAVNQSQTTVSQVSNASEPPKTPPKQEQLRNLLSKPNGVRIGTLCDRLGWQKHTVRAAISRLRRSGLTIESVPSPKTGETIYRLMREDAARSIRSGTSKADKASKKPVPTEKVADRVVDVVSSADGGALDKTNLDNLPDATGTSGVTNADDTMTVIAAAESA